MLISSDLNYCLRFKSKLFVTCCSISIFVSAQLWLLLLFSCYSFSHFCPPHLNKPPSPARINPFPHPCRFGRWWDGCFGFRCRVWFESGCGGSSQEVYGSGGHVRRGAGGIGDWFRFRVGGKGQVRFCHLTKTYFAFVSSYSCWNW